jgi:hypothetical protein
LALRQLKRHFKYGNKNSSWTTYLGIGKNSLEKSYNSKNNIPSILKSQDLNNSLGVLSQNLLSSNFTQIFKNWEIQLGFGEHKRKLSQTWENQNFDNYHYQQNKYSRNVFGKLEKTKYSIKKDIFYGVEL